MSVFSDMPLICEDNCYVELRSRASEQLLYCLAKKCWNHKTFLKQIFDFFNVNKHDKKQVVLLKDKCLILKDKENIFGDYDMNITVFLHRRDRLQMGRVASAGLNCYPFEYICQTICNQMIWRDANNYVNRLLRTGSAASGRLCHILKYSIDFLVFTRYMVCVEAVSKVMNMMGAKVTDVKLELSENDDNNCSFFKEAYCSSKKICFNISSKNAHGNMSVMVIICKKHIKKMKQNYNLFTSTAQICQEC